MVVVKGMCGWKCWGIVVCVCMFGCWCFVIFRVVKLLRLMCFWMRILRLFWWFCGWISVDGLLIGYF